MLAEMFTDAVEVVMIGGGDEDRERFMNEGGAYTNGSAARLIGRVIGLVLSVLIVLLIGKFLWNNAAVKLIAGLKPVKNILELLGLMLLIGLLFP
jgi:hypothetical protein